MNAIPDDLQPTDLPSLAALKRRARWLLVLLLLLLTSATLYLLYARGVFEPKQHFVLVTDDAEGAVVGMDMTFAGFPMGRVERISLSPDGQARMLVSVPRKNVHWLRTSSVVTMERSLVGGTRLRVYSGILTDPPLRNGAELQVLRGDAMNDIPKLVTGMREVLDNLQALTGPDSMLAQTLTHTAKTTGRLQERHGALGILLGNDGDVGRVMDTLNKTQALLTQLNTVAQRSTQMIDRTNALVARADSQLFGQQGLSEDARQIARQSQGVVAELQRTVQQAQGALVKVDDLLNDAKVVTGQTKDATGDLLALRADVETSLRRVQSLINDMQRRWPFTREPEVHLP
jgi:phospholipid/cholesterol/gamma-HCH transport system substrate-binding protein